MKSQNKDRQFYRDKASKIIETGVVQMALGFLSTVAAWAAKGPIGWFVGKMLEKVWDLTGDRLVRLAIRKGCLGVDLVYGQIRIRKIKDAKNSNDPDEYWRVMSDI